MDVDHHAIVTVLFGLPTFQITPVNQVDVNRAEAKLEACMNAQPQFTGSGIPIDAHCAAQSQPLTPAVIEAPFYRSLS